MSERRYTCRTCGRAVKAPYVADAQVTESLRHGGMGRSWCRSCETYEHPTEIIIERVPE